MSPEHQSAEFDNFDEAYRNLHQKSIGFSGERTDFFREYKIKDVLLEITKHRNPAGLSILDFGAGVEESVPYWKKFFPNSEITAADVSSKCLAKISQSYPDGPILQLNDEKIPLADDQFDAVFAACVFHHIDHDKHTAILKEIKRVLKPGGSLFIFEHNPFNPLTLYAVNHCEFDVNAKLISGFKIRKQMCSVGFQNCKIRYRVFFLGPFSALRPMEKYLSSIPVGGQYYSCGIK
jgi:ubiquinone/menaquinone biosynthesis C-methylase UbiE